MAKAANTRLFSVDWYDEAAAAGLRANVDQLHEFPPRVRILAGDWPNTVVFFKVKIPPKER